MEIYITNAIAGAVGQSVRILAGLKKAAERGVEFEGARMIETLVLGAVIGGAVGLFTNDPTMAFLAGYSGTDFIEAMARSYKG
ncbi:MAG: hypothetical protein DRO95_03185 [Candidatus Altiarchaeales archaeon]|nr:MAG: hypothetical protein DRO95_03185 [Candidatus Altiarchaeales archaeon]